METLQPGICFYALHLSLFYTRIGLLLGAKDSNPQSLGVGNFIDPDPIHHFTFPHSALAFF